MRVKKLTTIKNFSIRKLSWEKGFLKGSKDTCLTSKKKKDSLEVFATFDDDDDNIQTDANITNGHTVN